MRKSANTILDCIRNVNTFSVLLIYYHPSLKKEVNFNKIRLPDINRIKYMLLSQYMICTNLNSCFSIVTKISPNNTLFSTLDTKFALTDIEGDFYEFFVHIHIESHTRKEKYFLENTFNPS